MKISEAELAIMAVLWEQSPLSAADIARQLEDRDWSLQTVKTMLVRLEAKGALAHDEEGRRHVYRPCLNRDDFVDRESGRLMDRLFGGRAAPLIARLVERQKLSPDEAAEIQALLDRIPK